jgi:hypothetical protein
MVDSTASSNISDTDSVVSDAPASGPPKEVMTEEGLAKGEEFKQKGNDAFKSKILAPGLYYYLRWKV